MFHGSSEYNADKIAYTILREMDTFEVQDVGFWRNFLRFKYYKKLMKQVEKCEDKMLDKVDSLVASIANQVSHVRLATTDEQKEQCEVLVQEFQLKEPKLHGTPYGYGHHRVNISDGIQSSHACIMTSFPKGMCVAAICLSVEILNANGTVRKF